MFWDCVVFGEDERVNFAQVVNGIRNFERADTPPKERVGRVHSGQRNGMPEANAAEAGKNGSQHQLVVHVCEFNIRSVDFKSFKGISVFLGVLRA